MLVCHRWGGQDRVRRATPSPAHAPVFWPAARCLPFLAALCLGAGCEIRDQAPLEARRPAPSAGDHIAGDHVAGDHVAGGIEFVVGYERGNQTARAQQKPMMIFFTAQWCTYCRQMANEAFLQTAVVNLSRQFVCVLVDADAEPEICREFEVRSFPTIQFVSARQVRLNRLVGKQPPRELIAQMQAALETLARRPDLTTER